MKNTNLYTVSGSSPPTIEEIQKRILAFLFTRAEPITEKQIQRGVRVRKSVIVVALRKLHKQRKIRRIGLGINKCSFLYFLCGACLQRASKAKKAKGGRS